LKKQFDLNASCLADLTTQKQSSQQQILECLKNAGIDGVEELMKQDDLQFEAVLSKLETLL
jgi:hypothetical protein